MLTVSAVQAGFDESRTHIEQLLQQGKKVAILVIDMQLAYEGRGSLHNLSSVLGEQVKLLNYFVKNDQVIYVDVNIEEYGTSLNALIQSIYMKKGTRLMLKAHQDAFEGVNLARGQKLDQAFKGKLEDFLKSQDVTDVVPLGCFDSSCVLDTAKGAIESGFDVSVDRDMNIKYNAITDIGADNQPTEEAIEDVELEWQSALTKYPKLKVVSKASEPCEKQ
ncbi:isochorismatase family protein [Endozoicomonas arenosclerae]|uniref:isochorismatase family protein n=1 Tax=Endozoicomonas arenosclerae TaxID=1633495 RepID=UPI0015609B25|nr:isochorismatase family protein [Endozoicomonas arenosclerae]